MNPKKAVIIASIAAVLIGGAVLAIVLIRSRGLVEEPIIPPPGEGTTPPGDGGLQPGEGTGASVPSADEPGSATATPVIRGPAVTTVDPSSAADPTDPAPDDEGCAVAEDAIDCDYDHLTNAEERKYKTDPLKEDTDGDGVLDGSEVLTWKTDPLNARSVDPTMTDLEAIQAGKKNRR
jgi:hypothetical protein